MEKIIRIMELAAFIAVLLNSKPYYWIIRKLSLPEALESFLLCSLCFGFWFSLGFFVAPYGYFAFAPAGLTAAIAYTIDSFWEKYGRE